MLKALDTAVPIACWSCSIGHNDSTLFCPHCSKIQPPPGGDFFQVFGLQRRFAIDLSALEHEFHRLSRKVHPDRFARAGENERQWSLADTALLNDAYRTLKDSLHRTEYLLKLEGAEIGPDLSPESAAPARRGEADGKDRKDPSRVPADLLEEVFDLNIQLEEMRMARKTGEEEPELQASLEQAKRKFDGLLDEVDQDLRVQWQAWDEGDAAARHAAQRTMVALLHRRRYLSNLVRDVTETLGA
ncbi:MAG: Fe-S protein assembly co-chaperone HscB [Terracidiphilus sp.]